MFLRIINSIVRMDNREKLENVLPDPTSDLHLSGFVGAIQDIFSDNARKHPDRICVVETASSTMRHREFSYKQIDEASNLIAHHFLQCGIQRDEVIMIYAYRGVDLCIAIIAILKAGATFSVVDPAYDIPSNFQSEERQFLINPYMNRPNCLTDILPIDR